MNEFAVINNPNRNGMRCFKFNDKISPQVQMIFQTVV